MGASGEAGARITEYDNSCVLAEGEEAGQGGGWLAPAYFQSRQVRRGEVDSRKGKWSLGLAGSVLCVYEQESHAEVWACRLFKALFHIGSEMNQVRPWEDVHARLVLLLCEEAGPER